MDAVKTEESTAAAQSSGSSPPATGPQDCPTCVRRRIRCDRSLPTCIKCAKKSLVCPGYGPRLRWANGIAVRGHLKGRTTPHIEKPPKVSKAPSKLSTSPKSVKSSGTDDTPRTGPGIDPLEELFPGFPDPSTRSRLLSYYDQQIAGLMVWIDSEKNEYRRLVVPLAEQQPVLLLAILAISAQHLAVTTGQETSFPARARDAAVTMISKQIQQVTGKLAAGFDLGSQIDPDTAVWMLASMLTLANYEMSETETGAAAADSHRQAARTLVNALATTNRETNALFNFLRNQLAIYDILACTTIFGAMSTVEVILPAPDHSNLIFSEFLSLLHKVTIWSRQRHEKQFSGQFSLIDVPITSVDVRAGFEQARGSTLMAAGILALPRDARRRDFVRIVDIYHHAALLYTYRVLLCSHVEQTEINAAAMLLFERLDQLEDKPSCMQNLPWPVFIAGTECREDPARQAFVAKLYEDIAQDMGFKYYIGILHFLQDLWSNRLTDWTDLARRYEANGKKIVAV
ncbi:hypothetical protein A1O7_00210 [Cladophialophora yegresii CBS 114405]|uniref:Zn(2)-C6 fungal-type domain-containing protein n=1 Tax=Cladophialophora yegresii CBS 114405 TaxID=1182544 RepID=W9WFW8_9EURO|nr:uncharacterized protein A1O7_00210 [Cladophialophora yegresii CBS 114405]EXJ63875.1 hypothetical protein A1O7_00210 [Cladophialophora yegresii CBS 114405]